jgi:branched-chain amino acid transport system substrate-binding protein
VISQRRRKAWLALPAAMSLIVAGCSGSDDDSGDTAADTSVLGTANKATGTPVKVMYEAPGSQLVNHTQEIGVAKATASYINDYLGGINGHPIEIQVCEDAGQVGPARECANKAVADKDIVAVLTATPANPDAVVSVTSPAGLSFFSSAASGTKTATMPNTHVLLNGATVVGVPAYLAKEKGAKSAAIITIDAPIATGQINMLAPLVFGNAGAKAEIIPVPIGTPDMTSAVQTALNKKAEVIHILGAGDFCVSAFKAIRTLGVREQVTTIDQCIDKKVADQIPGGYEGVKVGVTASLDPEAQDTKVFNAVLDKYGVKDGQDGTLGFSSVLGFHRALSGMEGDLTRESVAAGLNKMPEAVDVPLGAGGTFQCGSKPVAVVPNSCSGNAVIGTADKDGNIGDLESVTMSELFAMPQG